MAVEKRSGLQGTHNPVVLIRWDGHGVETESGVSSFSIKDPALEGTLNTYCIGYKHLGGPLTEPASWEYDHTNYWDFDSEEPFEELEPRNVQRETIAGLLTGYGTSLEELLIQYCGKLQSV